MLKGKDNMISINGKRPNNKNYSHEVWLKTVTPQISPAVILSQDAIQEFKEVGGTYSAEYGFSANQVNIVSKSGGNQIDGVGFWTDGKKALDLPITLLTDKPAVMHKPIPVVAAGPVVFRKPFNC